MDARRAPPRICPGRGRTGGEHRLEFLPGPLGLSLVFEFVGEGVAQIGQHLHVEGRVAEQFLAQRTNRPVGRRMALFQVEAQHLLDQGAEGYARIAEQPPGQFGVKKPPRPEADLGQAGQVLGRRVQHRLGVFQRGVDAGQVGAGDGVDEHRARSGPAKLDQVGALPVAVTRGALGVDRDGSRARG